MKSMLKSLMSVAAAALALTSCSTDATDEAISKGGFKTLVVNASIDQTRTVMAENHVNLEWSADDLILLYIGEKATKADAKQIKPKTGGTITGVTYENGNTVYANYSLDNVDYSDGVTKAEIKIDNVQTQSEANVFAGENLPMTAKGEIKDGIVNLTFKPFGCVLVFNVYGRVEEEKVKSIKFETSVGCYGFAKCDLTLDKLNYTAYKDGKSATVTLTNPATIGVSKPSDTKVGENQIYLVVAPVDYPAGSKFTVTTDANKAYTFTTTSALDCSTTTARVVNLNLTKSAEMQPAIVVPDVPEQKSEGGDLVIENIVLKNIETTGLDFGEVVGVYSDAELTQPLTNSWLTIPNPATLATGVLNCKVAANETTESRTVYIGIKCGDVQAAIAITQVGTGSTPVESSVATYVPKENYNSDAVVSEVNLAGGSVMLNFAKSSSSNPPKYYASDKTLRCYTDNTITVTSTSKITKIKFVRSSAKQGNLSADVGTWSSDTFTWTGESEKVVFTVINDQFRIESMEITYVESKEPKIIVPTVADKQPAEGSTLKIQDIVFKNIEVANVTTGVYSDAELTKQENVDWLTISNPAETLAGGVLNCVVAANTGAERTAYIGIKGGGVQAAIAVTQKAQGAVDKYFVKITSDLEDWTGDYLIVYEGGNKAFNGALTGDALKSNNYITNFKISDQGILSNDTTNAALVKIKKIEGATNGYTLETASGFYLYSSSNSNQLSYTGTYETAAGHPNSIEIESNSAKIASEAAVLRFNTSNDYFRYYRSSTYTGQQPIQLYKLQK